MKFTDAFIRGRQTEKRLEDVTEGDGFGVRFYATGGKVFFFKYTFDGKRRFLNLGSYDPEFKTVGENGKEVKSLAYHRQKFTEAKNKLNKGIDPLQEKDATDIERKIIPFMTDHCSEYIERHAKKNKKSWENDEYLINKELLPSWGKRKISDITSRDIVLLLDKVVDRGAPVSANRIYALISKIFSFAIDRRSLEENPCKDVKRPTTEKPKTRRLSDDEIKTFWAALDGKNIQIREQTRNVYRLMFLTAQRPGEVIGMHESEIDGHWWTLPPSRTKNGKYHRVYLTDTVLGILGDYKGRGYIFPAGRGATGHATENSLSFALRRNIKGQSVGKDKIKRRKGEDYKRGAYKTEKPLSENPNRIGVETFSPHDIRRTIATMMASCKVPFESRERVLNHSLSKMDDTYNLHDFDEEKKEAMEEIELKINCILSGSEYRNKKQREDDQKAAVSKQAAESKQNNVVDFQAARLRKAA